MKKIVIKYLNEEITSEELEGLKQWISIPGNQEKFREYVKTQYLLNSLNPPVDPNKALEKVLDKISEDHQPGEKKMLVVREWMKYAAVFIGIIITVYGLFHQELFNQPQSEQSIQITLQLEDGDVEVVQENDNEVITAERGNILIRKEKDKLVYTKTQTTTDSVPHFNTLKIPYGKLFEVVLTDGTKIKLNAGSSLKYPTFFPDGKNRIVYLEGEAFFEVSEDATRPFVVETEKMNIRVLGTSFNVSSYYNDESTTAVLATGKIEAIPADQEFDSSTATILFPGQKASIEKGKIEVVNVNVEKYTAWTSGKLMFINERYEVIEKKLERHYNVEIINKCRRFGRSTFKGTFENVELEKVLKTFQIHTPFTYKIKDHTVTISNCEEK